MQLDFDTREKSSCATCGTKPPELEAKRTTDSSELMVFF